MRSRDKENRKQEEQHRLVSQTAIAGSSSYNDLESSLDTTSDWIFLK